MPPVGRLRFHPRHPPNPTIRARETPRPKGHCSRTVDGSRRRAMPSPIPRIATTTTTTTTMTCAASSSRMILMRGGYPPSFPLPHLNLIVVLLVVAVATAPTQQPPSSNTPHCCEDAPFTRDSLHCDPARAKAFSRQFSTRDGLHRDCACHLVTHRGGEVVCSLLFLLLEASKISFLQKRNEFLAVPSRSVRLFFSVPSQKERRSFS